uniref:Uncharacterized protein n=1 Tax=Arundo donax TaxID=35708 RepID=A0A0A9EGS4_ARUDO
MKRNAAPHMKLVYTDVPFGTFQWSRFLTSNDSFNQGTEGNKWIVARRKQRFITSSNRFHKDKEGNKWIAAARERKVRK